MAEYGTVELASHNGAVGVAVRAVPHVMMRLKRIFPRVSRYSRGAIFVRSTPEIGRDLEWVMDRWPMAMDEATRQHVAGEAQKHRDTHERVNAILDGYIPPSDLPPPDVPPRSYQEAAAELVRATGRLLLTDELGLGKTFAGLLVLRDPKALPALVVTMTHLPAQWLAELNRFLPWLRGHVVRKGQPYDPAAAKGAHGYAPDVLIMNYAKLAGWQHHLAGRVNTVIFDEAQELRRNGTLKYEAAVDVAHAARFRVGLTATPIYNYGDEIYNVVNALDPEALGARDEFRREWCNGSDRIGDPRALGTYLREEGLMLRRTRKEVGRELPEVQRVVHSIALDDADMDIDADIEALAEKILARDGTKEELWRASGDLDWRLRMATGIAKAPYVAAFTRMLLEAEEPVVLFGWHHEVYDTWRVALANHRPAFFTGTESVSQKNAATRAFLGGDTNLLVMSLRAGAGLDGLQERAHVAVFGELDWSPGVHEQCLGRLHRDGQDDPVVGYFLVGDSGSDPVVAEALNLKRQSSEPIVDPDAEVMATMARSDRIKALAAEFLRRRGRTPG